jgi:benzylsuccinate CoA-transferase BbsF subunit
LLASEAVRERPRAELLAQARALDVPMVPLNRPEEFVEEEQTRVRGYFRRTGFPHVDDAPFASPPFNMSATPWVLACPAPQPNTDEASFAPREPVRVREGSGPVLAGVRVVDLGVGVAGPEVGWILAELGAEVAKIESRANLDFLRRVTVEPDAVNRSWTYNDASRGQRSVCLDLRTERGRAVALDLCAAADVVIENNRGGVARRFGLDYEPIRARRPDVIYYSSQAFGRGGPLGEASAFGPLNSAFAGVTWLWNHADSPYPGGCALNHPDHTAAKLAAGIILAALEHRRRTGEGQMIEMSQAESAAYLLGDVYLHETCTGRRVEQTGNTSPYAAPHGVYPCEARTDGSRSPSSATKTGRHSDEHLGGLTIRASRRQQVVSPAAPSSTPASPNGRGSNPPRRSPSSYKRRACPRCPSRNGDDHRADLHLTTRGAIVTVEHPEIGPERHIGNPIRFSALRPTPAGRAPLMGEHTTDVLMRWLKLTEADVRALETEGTCR